MNHHGILHRHAHLGAYNTALLLEFLNGLYDVLVQPDDIDNPQRVNYIIIWDNDHPRFSVLYLPPYSPFLNPIEEFFSAWKWKVYERNPQSQAPLLQAMEEGCGDVAIETCQGFMRHSRRYFQRCLDQEDIACDYDEALWPDRDQRHDAP
uniref:Tc1-like transposase DDE domain-containing protein n=2 Tax=Iconisemion striatum TaxID=60296 RepID=A0A1A7W7E2_9TELE